VNIDEEMSNLLQYQHAYAAAGQLVSTINDMLDTLINMVR
jgi:flagellar hook-associated protein 1 FlgK